MMRIFKINKMKVTLYFCMFSVLGLSGCYAQVNTANEMSNTNPDLSKTSKIDAASWIAKRRQDIKSVLEKKNLYIPENLPTDTAFCRRFEEDIKSMKKIDIVAPELESNGIYTPEVVSRVFENCSSDMFTPSHGLELPRKIILYNVDIDNNAKTGIEWVLEDHLIKPISPEWGRELLVRNEYIVLDTTKCRLIDSRWTGSSERYPPDTKYTDIELITGLHGVMRYDGKYYLYNVINDKNAPPITIEELHKNKARSICVIYQK